MSRVVEAWSRLGKGKTGVAIKWNYFGSREVSRLAIVTLFIFEFSGVFRISRYSWGGDCILLFFFVSYCFHRAITEKKNCFIIIFILIIGLKEKKIAWRFFHYICMYIVHYYVYIRISYNPFLINRYIEKLK